MKVRLAKESDLKVVVDIHLKRFNDFFLTSLGKFFLIQFYKGFLKEPGILLIIEDNFKVVGFAAGSFSNNGFFKKLLVNNLIGFAKAGIIVALSNPSALIRIGSNANKASREDLEFSELLSICTLPNKKGYGKILLKAFENYVFSKSKLPISLTTDFCNNEKTVTFYKDCGYSIYKVFDSYKDRKMYRFLKNND
ncbi:N-acetyltransferase [Paenimyroides tangerinum]|uniref:N-acetyltransferase n=1 Tax=Paenimyroides tangerinum TaxID=2488728 RepID=A0A3P3W7I4_9FLAO|nr:GNAT family N-acetyltransferase [Paenimyroides tangerinum]RRJ89569.1 N-acetyltransferase [Paenimyroides tangerinum]